MVVILRHHHVQFLAVEQAHTLVATPVVVNAYQMTILLHAAQEDVEKLHVLLTLQRQPLNSHSKPAYLLSHVHPYMTHFPSFD